MTHSSDNDTADPGAEHPLMNALMALAHSDDEGPGIRQLIEKHPELLHPEVDRVLRDSIHDPRATPEVGMVMAQRRFILQRCRDLGTERAFVGMFPSLAISDDNKRSRGLREACEQLDLNVLSIVYDAERVANCERALLLLDQTKYSYLWGHLQWELGVSLRRLPAARKNQRTAGAIQAFQRALAVFTDIDAKFEQAETCEQLGLAHVDRFHETADDQQLELAQQAFQQARETFTKESYPRPWGRTTAHLSLTYWHGAAADSAAEHAITYAEQALGGLSPEKDPDDYDAAAQGLAQAIERAAVSSAEVQERAIALMNQVRDAAPEISMTRAAALRTLGCLYPKRVLGSPDDNREAGRLAQEQASVLATQLSKHSTQPSQSDLFKSDSPLLYLEQSDNIDHSIKSGEETIRIPRLQETDPQRWINGLLQLSAAYLMRPHGDAEENCERALLLAEQALESCESAQAAWVEDARARAQMQLATAYNLRVRGDQDDNNELAIALYEAALPGLSRDKTSSNWANTANNLAGALLKRSESELGLDDDDDDDGDEVADAEDAGNDHDDEIDANNEVSKASLTAKRAEALWEEIRSRCLPQAYPTQWARATRALAIMYQERCQERGDINIQRSMALFEEALTVFTRDDWPVEWAGTLHSMSHAFLKQDIGDDASRIKNAKHCCEQALEVLDADGYPDGFRSALSILAQLDAAEGHWEQSAERHLQVLRSYEASYQAALLQAGRAAQLHWTGVFNQQAAYSLARAGRLREAVLALEASRARRLGESQARDRADLEAVARQDRDAYLEYLRASTWMRQIEGREQAAGEQLSSVESRTQLQRLREEAQRARQKLTAAITRIRALPGHDGFLAAMSWESCAAALLPGPDLAPGDEPPPIVYLLSQEVGSMALLLYPGLTSAEVAVEVCWLDANAELSESSALYDDPADGSDEGYLDAALQVSTGPTELGTSLARLLPLLGRTLISDVAARLRARGAEAVVLIPCGYLGLLPLHAATYELAGQQVCLLDEFTVSYIPSARAMHAARTAVVQRQGTQTLCGIGNPLPSPSPMPVAKDEVEALAQYFPQNARTTLYGRHATKEAVLAHLAHATYVHFSCHGSFDVVDPLDSELALANEESLTLRELLAQESLDAARLVTLSACQTAMAEFFETPDELIGWPASLLQLGVPGAMGALWSVNSVATAMLMMKFYEYHLEGEPMNAIEPMAPALALRRAQRWLREAGRAELTQLLGRRARLLPEDQAEDVPPFHAAQYWAGFIFVGT